MAIAANSLTAGREENAAGVGTTSVTASISPADDALVLVAVIQETDDSTNPAQPSLSGGGMAAWTHVAGVVYDSALSFRFRLDVFRALEASPGTGTLTITNTDGTNTISVLWAIEEFTGVDTGGSNGADAVVQSDSNSGASVSSIAATLSAFGATANRGYKAGGTNSSAGARRLDVESGFTELQIEIATVESGQVITGWRDNDTADLSPTVDDAGDPGTFDMGIVALELKAALASYDQDGYRWYDDDGNESSSTALAAEDTAPSSLAKETTARLRAQVDVTNDPGGGKQFKLQWKKSGDADSEYRDVA